MITRTEAKRRIKVLLKAYWHAGKLNDTEYKVRIENEIMIVLNAINLRSTLKVKNKHE